MQEHHNKLRRAGMAVGLWQEICVDNLRWRPGTPAERSSAVARFRPQRPGRPQRSCRQSLVPPGLQPGILHEETAQLTALCPDGTAPALPGLAPLRLVPPLEQMHKQHIKAAGEFPLLTLAQALYLLCQALRVDVSPLPRTNQGGSGLRPGVEILLVEFAIAAHPCPSLALLLPPGLALDFRALLKHHTRDRRSSALFVLPESDCPVP